MKASYQQVIQFLNAVVELRGDSRTPLTKFHYAIDKMRGRIMKACKAIEKKYAEEQTTLQIKYASVDKNQNLVMENDRYTFTKENWDAYQKDLSHMYDLKNLEAVEVEPFIAQSVPANLTMAEAEALAGFILPENYEIPEPEN